jgi:hypothetical protein
MIHPSKKGIYCDLCGLEVLLNKGTVNYYNSNIKHIIANKEKITPEDVLDIDICEKCYKELHQKVYKISIENNKKVESYARHI